jgi:hypothetical protein
MCGDEGIRGNDSADLFGDDIDEHLDRDAVASRGERAADRRSVLATGSEAPTVGDPVKHARLHLRWLIVVDTGGHMNRSCRSTTELQPRIAALEALNVPAGESTRKVWEL